MAVASLGFRTDLMILSLLGSTVEHEDGYAVVRTPSNPTFHWGNFLLLAGPPAPGSVPGWVETFSRTFPDAEHLTLGVDGTDGEAGDPAELARLGLEREISTVMTATTVHPPPRPNTYATYRPLDGDADWSAALAVRAAGNEDFPPEDYLVFARRHLDSMRALQEQGYGAWFGAFVDDAMVAGLGIFADTDGVARFQS
ncbi:MAG: GNAT family N-acetyltransferase, partial [Nocardioidaceae bacterium]